MSYERESEMVGEGVENLWTKPFSNGFFKEGKKFSNLEAQLIQREGYC